LDVMGVPTVKHFEHDLMHLLAVWLGNI
ncbi:MAG: hypothetical protein QOI53_294, partial [Verrucomicrobiota bacterium]|nr:hypothetical protein [Verrucomicrobiota bacterium]